MPRLYLVSCCMKISGLSLWDERDLRQKRLPYVSLNSEQCWDKLLSWKSVYDTQALTFRDDPAECALSYISTKPVK